METLVTGKKSFISKTNVSNYTVNLRVMVHVCMCITEYKCKYGGTGSRQQK